ncbi:MAG TPA: D-cysteine desulfhydrase family protein, partial [Thermosynergistes sp.]|nr:D-cysteine desulfhydrase family protein [Thermosynergistes sp.]
MNLSRFPRRRYTEGWTPMERLGRLSALMNGPEIWIKRDDLLGLSPGGNKTRKLEFVMADALAKGADSVITCGAVQSNHCRITLAAARKEGLECHFVIEERVPGSYSPTASGNNFLYHLMGVDSIRVVPAKSDMIAEMEKTADELRRAGKKPYIIPGGASNPLGALGYVACAEEILAQSFEKGVSFDRIFVTSGSGGSSVTPIPCDSADAAAGATVEMNNSTVSTTNSTAPCTTIRSGARDAASITASSSRPDTKSSGTASMTNPCRAPCSSPVWPVAIISTRRPRRSSSLTSDTSVVRLPTSQSVPSTARRGTVT